MFPWIWDKLNWLKFVLVRSEILELLFNILTAEDKYSRRNMENFPHQHQVSYLRKKQFFLDFLLRFWNVHQVQNILKQKMSLLI